MKEVTSMKNLFFSVAFALVFLAPITEIKAQSPVAAFTGGWVLDMEKTTGKNLPAQLKNYKMLVGESENLLNVKSQALGPLEIIAARGSSGTPNIVANPRTSSASPTGVSATTLGSTEAGKANYGGTLALYFTPNEATYNLNGEEVKVELKQGEKVIGIARIKAKLEKNGKTLQFSTIRRMKTPNGEMEIFIREWWKISDDGKSLKMQRTVETPTARDEITMFLMRPPQ